MLKKQTKIVPASDKSSQKLFKVKSYLKKHSHKQENIK